MIIEFFNKLTGELCEEQHNFMVDKDGDVFEFEYTDIDLEEGRHFINTEISWRIVNEN